MAVFLDMGRYWNGYNLFLPWHVNFNSVLVEVALCIAAYVVVLWLELAPTMLEGQARPQSRGDQTAFGTVAAGHRGPGHPAADDAPILAGDVDDYCRA